MTRLVRGKGLAPDQDRAAAGRPLPPLRSMSPGQLIDTIEGQRATIAALESRITELQARLHAAGIAGHLLAGALFPVGRSVDPPTEAAKTAGNAMIDQALARARRPPAANSPRRKRL